MVNRAVMETRATGPVEADDPLTALYRALEFFPTPPWAARAGAQLIKRFDPLCESVWEPAAGQGHMAEPFKEFFPHVIASDIYDYGAGYTVDDFLLSRGAPCCDWVATNPPFERGEDFARHAMLRARRGVAILARTAWLEGEKRHRLFYPDETSDGWPLLICAPFSERVAMTLGKWSPNASTMTAYAWFLFMKPDNGPRWTPRLHHIGPGTRERLAKAEDVRQFCKPPAMPLFGDHS